MAALTFILEDAPYSAARVVSALRLVEAALRAGHDVNVFAYENAVGLPFAAQKPHPNLIKGTGVEQEGHPLPKDWVAALAKLGDGNEGRGKLEWVNCGLCVDERGTHEVSAGRRGGPKDLAEFIARSTNVLCVGTR
jgi:tRNA 2-thiouridine synthesizing protein D